jgi:ribosomal-protein-alanine N-acetyltransferase
MVTETCAFETDRLSVGEWHAALPSGTNEHALADIVTSLMTAPVTQALPAEWRGAYTRPRAEAWVTERDGEGPTLLAIERATGSVVGLVILFESDSDNAGVDVRLGYLLAEAAWGRGLGGELVEGFVGWCRAQPGIRTLIAGVAVDNLASIRILEKTGFLPLDASVDDPRDDWASELTLR